MSDAGSKLLIASWAAASIVPASAGLADERGLRFGRADRAVGNTHQCDAGLADAVRRRR